jgi:hypothetical protein
MHTVPNVEGEILVLKTKNERRAVCIALWRISSSVSCIDSKFSYNPHNKATTLYQNFNVKVRAKNFAENFHFHKKRKETSVCKKICSKLKKVTYNVGGVTSEVLFYVILLFLFY